MNSAAPRTISVVVDNESWILPFASALVQFVNDAGDRGWLCRTHDIPQGDIAFYLGCIKIAPPHVLARNRRNLIVHGSDLPKGRGFSPLTWLTLQGETVIPMCLLDAVEGADEGPVVYRDSVSFEGHELIDEMRFVLGRKTVDLCTRFLADKSEPAGVPQQGEPSYFGRRRPADSMLDPNRTIADQFNLLRTVDNANYPAFFDHRGHRYRLKIEKIEKS